MIELAENMNQVKAWRGLRQATKDTFSAGSDALLSALTPAWTRIAGTGTIRSDGAGTAYSNSGGLGTIVAYYAAQWNGQSNNRIIRCYVTSLNIVGAHASAGVCVRLNAARAFSAVYVYANGVTGNDDFYLLQDYGAPATVGLGSIAGAGSQHYFVLKVRGSNLIYDIDSGTLTGTQGLGGQPYYPSGLYYSITNSVGARAAEWQDWDCRMYAH